MFFLRGKVQTIAYLSATMGRGNKTKDHISCQPTWEVGIFLPKVGKKTLDECSSKQPTTKVQDQMLTNLTTSCSHIFKSQHNSIRKNRTILILNKDEQKSPHDIKYVQAFPLASFGRSFTDKKQLPPLPTRHTLL